MPDIRLGCNLTGHPSEGRPCEVAPYAQAATIAQMGVCAMEEHREILYLPGIGAVQVRPV